ncbi:uncharacterized protein METZ01_LOCUS254025, partial [marine metagenome]
VATTAAKRFVKIHSCGELRVSPGELNENGGRLYRPSKAGLWSLDRL